MSTNLNNLQDYINSEEFKSLTTEEQSAVFSVLKEMANNNGKSSTYNHLLYDDYSEIPVDIETFLTDDNYLGRAWKDASGKSKVYPFWMETLKKLFPTNIDTAYDTLLESGARGIGKSEVGCGAVGAYLMYRILCLKNPLEYYHLKPTEKICFAFMNIKKDLAKEIAIDKFQKTIQMSPWFMSRGRMTTFEGEPYWIPPNYISIIIGSQSDDVIGLPIFFCLDGDTIIKTTNGDEKLSSLVGKDIQVKSIDNDGNEVISEHCTVKPTLKTNEEYQIELEDGTIIKCTPTHRFMLKDGTYKEAQYLTEEDELFDENITYKDFIDNIIKTRGQWNIPEGEYFEAHHIIPKCLGGQGRIKSGRKYIHHPNIIHLYASEHYIAHKLLAKENPTNQSLTYAWSMMAFPKGKTNREYVITAEDYEELRKRQALLMRNINLSREPWNKGKHGVYSEETLQKIRAPRPQMQGIKKSESTRKKISDAQRKRYLDKPETFAKPTLNKYAITNGDITKYIDKEEILPKGFRYGQTHKKKYTIKDIEKFKKLKSDQVSGKGNPMYGKGYKLKGGKNGHAIYIYTYKGIDYDCRDDLMVVLKQEFPKISESTIRRIMRNNYTIRTSKKYQEVIDNLSWRLKSNEN